VLHQCRFFETQCINKLISITEFHWTTLSKKFKSSNLPIYSKTEKYFLDTPTQIVNPPALPDEPPWHLKECSVDTSLINFGKKQDNPQLLKALSLEKIENYKNTVHIQNHR